MARLDIEIAGDSKKLLSAISEGKRALEDFNSIASKIKPINFGGSAKGGSGLDAVRAEAIRLSATIKDSLAESYNNARKATESARQVTEDYKQTLLSTKNAIDQQKIATEAQRTALNKSKADMAELALATRRNKVETDVAVGSYREAQIRLTALGQAIRNAKGGFDATTPAIRAQISAYNDLNNKLKAFDVQLGNHQRKVGNYPIGINQLSQSVLGAVPVVGQLTNAVGLATLAFGGLQKSFTTNLKLDALEYSLKQVSKTASDFETNMEFLRLTSDRLGLDFISTAEAFKLWQGSAKFANITSEESRRIFESVANAGAKLKLSTDNVRGTFLALSQIMSKGKVQAEELRGQLGERLPGAFAIASKAIGVSEQELNKMLETGQVLAKDFLPKFATELDKSFGNDKTERIDSMQASVNRLKTEFDLLFDSDQAKGFFTDVLDGLSAIVRETKLALFEQKGLDEIFGLRAGKSIFDKQYPGKPISGEQLTVQSLSTKGAFKTFGRADTPQALTRAVDKNSESVVKNRDYWDSQVKQLKSVITAMDSAKIGTEEYNKALANLRVAQKNYDSYEINKPRKNSGKSDLNKAIRDQKELDKISRELFQSSLSPYEAELDKILQKYEEIRSKVKNPDLLKLAEQNAIAEILKANIKQIGDFVDKLKKAKPLQLITDTTVKIPDITNRLDRDTLNFNSKVNTSTYGKARMKEDDKLENRLSKVVESGFRKGITSILGNITELGSNFREVFTNVFQNLAGSVNDIFKDLFATKLGNLLKSSFDDIDIAGLGNKVSQGIIAGAGIAGGLISGTTKKTSYAGQGIGGAVAGASAGLALGPIGAIAGGLIGGIAGLFSAKSARKQEETQRKQLEEQKKQTLLQERIASLTYASNIIGQRTSQGIVNGVGRNALGELTFRIDGRDLVATYNRETEAQKRGL